MTRQITELEELSTLGVSVVKRGANRKWFSLTKNEKKTAVAAQTGATTVTKKEQVQAAVKALIAKGELPDEAAIEKLCQQQGLDEKETEGMKAILRIRAAFPNSQKLDVAFDAIVAATEGGVDPNAQQDPNATDAQQDPNAPGAPAAGSGKPPFQKPGAPQGAATEGEDEEQEGDEPAPDAEEGDEPSDNEEETADKPGEKKFPSKDKNGDEDMTTDKDKEPKKPFAKTEGGADMIAKSEVEALFKSQAEAIEKAEKRANDLEAIVKAETDKRRSAEWLAKAKEHLAFVPGKSTEEIALMLKSAEDKDPKFAEDMFEMFKSTSAAMAKSDLLQDSGSGGGAGASSTALDKLAKIAAEKLAKSDDGDDLKYVSPGLRGEIRKARAMQEAMQENKPLYMEFLAQSKR